MQLVNIRIYKGTFIDGSIFFGITLSEGYTQAKCADIQRLAENVKWEIQKIIKRMNHAEVSVSVSVDLKPLHDIEFNEGEPPHACTPLNLVEASDFWRTFSKEWEKSDIPDMGDQRHMCHD